MKPFNHSFQNVNLFNADIFPPFYIVLPLKMISEVVRNTLWPNVGVELSSLSLPGDFNSGQTIADSCRVCVPDLGCFDSMSFAKSHRATKWWAFLLVLSNKKYVDICYTNVFVYFVVQRWDYIWMLFGVRHTISLDQLTPAVYSL